MLVSDLKGIRAKGTPKDNMLETTLIKSELLILILGFVVIAISANQIAKTFQKIRLPLITGLIFTGIIAGPYILGLIPVSSKSELNFINEIALAFIAFAAGAVDCQ